jgi:hypothetical protein
MKLASPRLFLQPHANSLILILGKRYSFFFEGPLDFHDGRKIPLNNPLPLLNPSKGGQTYFGSLGQILLSPPQKCPGCSNLRRIKHAGSVFDSFPLAKHLVMSSYHSK